MSYYVGGFALLERKIVSDKVEKMVCYYDPLKMGRERPIRNGPREAH